MKKGGLPIRFWNRTKSYILLAVMFGAIFGIGYGVFALTGTLKERNTKKDSSPADERVEQMVNGLGLSGKDAAVFRPVYQKYLKEITPLRKRAAEILQELTDARSGVSVETSQIEELTEEFLEAQKAEEEMTERYRKIFTSVLPADRVSGFSIIDERNRMMEMEVELTVE